ncbi:MAG: sigma-E processing peptidase SpoIIGA [Oscillospiraceae bacterium]|nr:sigma-E processing peptidase SpoIIGA [Oscillospiraceae bacterium]
MVVYADVLFLINFLLDGLLLLAAAATAKLPPPKKIRLFSAACLGGVSSLILLLPRLPGLFLFFLQLALSFLVCFVAMGPLPPVNYFFFSFTYYALGLLLGGLCQLTDQFLSPAGLYYHNRVLYLNLNFWQLLILVCGIYLAVKGISLLRVGSEKENQRAELSITFRGKQITLPVLLDSGNLLTDPATGRPVAICRLQALYPLFSEEEQQLFSDEILSFSPLFAEREIFFRPVPYEAVGGGGMVAVFTPDETILSFCDGKRLAGDWVIGILSSSLGQSKVEGILRLQE